MDVSRAMATRRSLRRFAERPVPADIIQELVRMACAAPAPHHTRPWRFVAVRPETRARLATAMTDAWRRGLTADGAPPERVEQLTERSQRRIESAPTLLLAGIDLTGARQWPDAARRAAERDMFVQSLGAALQNLLLAAHANGLGGYVLGSPLFCQPAVREALALPPEIEPLFLVMLGYPPAGHAPQPRPDTPLEDVLSER